MVPKMFEPSKFDCICNLEQHQNKGRDLSLVKLVKVFLLIVPRRFLCISSSLCVRRRFHMCLCRFLISSSSGTLGRLYFVIVAFVRYLIFLDDADHMLY